MIVQVWLWVASKGFQCDSAEGHGCDMSMFYSSAKDRNGSDSLFL